MWYRFALAVGITGFAMAAQAQAQAPRQPPPAAKPKPPANAPDPAYDAAKAAFEALPEAVRQAIQDSLVWTGDYNAVTAGTFGRRTYDGIVAFQARTKAEPTGILTAPQRAALDVAGEAARTLARFKVQADTASGVVIGVPEKLLPKRAAQAGGTRWQSADGRVTLDTKSFPPGEADLDALFERAIAGGPDRKITYKLKKPDFIVVTGETATGRSYLRYTRSETGTRGFVIAYAKPLAGEIDRLVIAIANSFVPFPETGEAASAPKPPGMAATPGAASTIRAPAAPAATGLSVAPGRVLTSAAALGTCPTPRIGAAPARAVLRDPAGALALIEVEARPSSMRAGAVPDLRSDPLAPDEALVVLGAEAKGAASVAPAVAGSETSGTGKVFAPLQPGAGGAPVLDRSGRLAGLVARFPEAPRLVAGVMPPTSYGLIPARVIASFLAEKGITVPARPASTGTLGTAAGPVIGAIVAIECGR